MIIKINDERGFEQSTLYFGYLEENNSTTIEFEFPEYLEKYNKKLNFMLADGTTVCKLFDDINSNKFTFTRDLLKFNKLQMAIEFFDTNEDLIYRTSILTIRISDSIICDDDVTEDDPKIIILDELIQKVNELNTETTENEATRESNEQTRISNEDTRVANETARQEYVTQLKKDVELGNFDGATFTPHVSESGDLSWSNNKNLSNPETVNIKGEKGDKGQKGDTGAPFRIVKTYPSIEAMQADFDNMEVGDYVMITSSIELEDNAKLYCKTETEWVYITDFSGATGIQGEKGDKGDKGDKGEKGDTGVGISKLEVIDGALYVTLTNNVKENAGVILTDEVKSWLVSQITDNAESDFNTYYNSKVEEFNTNATEKTTAYNNNAEDKLSEYNTNATNKISEYNSNAEAILKILPKTETEVQENIDIDDAGESNFNKLDVYGNSRQESTEGYNLLNNILESQTVNGVTVTVNEDKSITLNGTSTGAITLNYTNDFGTINSDYIFYLIGKNNKINLQGVENEETVAYLAFSNNNNNVKKNYETDTIITRVFSYINAGTTFNNETFYPMITKGTEEKSYEPYTGGNPSPNPDYPQKINSVANMETLLVEDDAIQNKYIESKLNQVFSLGTSAITKVWQNVMKVDSGKKYTISWNKNTLVDTATRQCVITNDNNSVVQEFVINPDSETYELTATVDGYLSIGMDKNASTVKVSKQYGEIKFKRIGKNIFSINNVVGNDANRLILNVLPGASIAQQPFKLKSSEQVTVSFKTSDFNSINSWQLATALNDEMHNYSVAPSQLTQQKTFTLDKDCDAIGLIFYAKNIFDTDFEIYDIQIEKGTEATEYEPYHEDVYTLPVQQEMLKINDYEDLFIKKDDGNWYEKHVIKKYIIDGENNIFSNMLVGEVLTTFDFVPGGIYDSIFTNQEYWVVCDNALCNMFKPSSLGQLVVKNNIEHINRFCTWGSYARFSFENNKFASVDEVNQYLSELNTNNKPLILYVALKTPEEILCTPEQVEVLNQLEQFSLSKGTNHIFSDDELSPKFQLKYYQDMNILLDKINKNIADVSAQLI